jgi:hypothetical protein
VLGLGGDGGEALSEVNPGTRIFLLKRWQGKLLHTGHVPKHFCSNFVHLKKRKTLVPG